MNPYEFDPKLFFLMHGESVCIKNVAQNALMSMIVQINLVGHLRSENYIEFAKEGYIF